MSCARSTQPSRVSEVLEVAKALVRGASEGETFARKCINALT